MSMRTADAAPADAAPAASQAYRVIAHGDVDVKTASQLAEQLDASISAGAHLVVLDASDVTFLDSSGLRVIVAASQQLEARGGRLLIDGLRGSVQRVLEITGLLDRYTAPPAAPAAPRRA